MVNPGEMHDGMPVNGGARGWRILYLDPATVAYSRVDLGLPVMQDHVQQ
jgi:hypothetical protein